MKISKLFYAFFALSFCASILNGQTTFKGTKLTGVSVNDGGFPIANGAYGWWIANKGIVLNGTNVQAWQDQTANKWNLSQFNTTNQPWFIPSYTTNDLPAVYFESI